MANVTDYDALRAGVGTDAVTYVEELGIRRNDLVSGNTDADFDGSESSNVLVVLDAEPFLGDELGLPVVVEQDNEFTCSRCFLIVHRSRYARTLRSKPVCRDCS